jgi:AraC-like DNA-binding protein
MGTMDESCTVRMVQPFMRFASSHEAVRDLVAEQLFSMDLDARIPLRAAHDALALASERMRDRDLALKLGNSFAFGTGGTFDYVVRSAATISDSLAVAARYSKLLASPFTVTHEHWKRHSVIRFDDQIPWETHTGDFGLAAWYRAHAADELPKASRPECWFPYAAPEDTREYHRVFPGTSLRFNAPFLGLVFDREYADAPMPVSDPVLHSIICARADSLLTAINESQAITLRVRRVIAYSIHQGTEPTALGVARLLHMSRRTLSRRLEDEGTSFTEELDKTRRELGLSYVRESKLSLIEIAFQLGFAHVESFNRAFKRWTGTTPLAYRTSHEK